MLPLRYYSPWKDITSNDLMVTSHITDGISSTNYLRTPYLLFFTFMDLCLYHIYTRLPFLYTLNNTLNEDKGVVFHCLPVLDSVSPATPLLHPLFQRRSELPYLISKSNLSFVRTTSMFPQASVTTHRTTPSLWPRDCIPWNCATWPLRRSSRDGGGGEETEVKKQRGFRVLLQEETPRDYMDLWSGGFSLC